MVLTAEIRRIYADPKLRAHSAKPVRGPRAIYNTGGYLGPIHTTFLPSVGGLPRYIKRMEERPKQTTFTL